MWPCVYVPKGPASPCAISCSLQCYFGPADHSILSSPCGLCFADRTTWILERLESDLQSLANEGTEGIMKELGRCQEGCLDGVQLDERPLSGLSLLLKAAAKAICSSPCLLLVHFMTHFWLCNWKFLTWWVVGTSWPYLMSKKDLRKMFAMLWCWHYIFICLPLSYTCRQVMSDKHRNTSLTCFQFAKRLHPCLFVVSQTLPSLNTWWQEFLPAQSLM